MLSLDTGSEARHTLTQNSLSDLGDLFDHAFSVRYGIGTKKDGIQGRLLIEDAEKACSLMALAQRLNDDYAGARDDVHRSVLKRISKNQDDLTGKVFSCVVLTQSSLHTGIRRKKR
jgi:hypothetical protein